jgi:hypothetical protein
MTATVSRMETVLGEVVVRSVLEPTTSKDLITVKYRGHGA